MAATPDRLTPAQIAQRTNRYVRVAVAGSVGMLLISVGFEVIQVHGQFRTSISSYYWTPVGPVFIAALVTAGVCLIAIQGSTTWEDYLLNAAGALAPVVAFVPIPNDSGEPSSAPSEYQKAVQAISLVDSTVKNNVSAYILAAMITLGVVFLVLFKAGSTDSWKGGLVDAVGPRTVGFLVAFGFGLAGWAWFRCDDEGFRGQAHKVSAFLLFALLVAVMILNARSYDRTQTAAGMSAPASRNRYALIAWVTVIAATLVGLQKVLKPHWSYALLVLELVVIVGFAVFWITQSVELWNEPSGVREDPDGVLPRAPEDQGAPRRASQA